MKRQAYQPIGCQRKHGVHTLLTGLDGLPRQTDQVIHSERIKFHAMGYRNHIFQQLKRLDATDFPLNFGIDVTHFQFDLPDAQTFQKIELRTGGPSRIQLH